MKTPELKACPFCGGNAVIYFHIEQGEKLYAACCGSMNCDMSVNTPYSVNIDDVAAIWNRRVNE